MNPLPTKTIDNQRTLWYTLFSNSRNSETYNAQRLEVANLGNYGSFCEKYRSHDHKMWGGQETTLSL